MNIEQVILGFIYGEAMTGYELKKRFDESVAHFFGATFSGIYPALRRMEKEGLIEKEVVPQEGRPSKNIVRITEKGRQSFADYLKSPLSPGVQKSDLLVRYFFGRYAAEGQIRGWLLEERERMTDTREGLLHMRRGALNDPETDAFRLKTLEMGIAQIEFSLRWIDEELAMEPGAELTGPESREERRRCES
ncbi:PadR family transcriptional regulator [Paenibacillus chitinolyticus]|uniref:PadR family transcriptional regulator n=1 Tax=Paenibacillus chitinolyticus TaxID=79263 RepID=A0ABT4FEM0_9BACL|nr:PadR family transcriptional regulator [Paenibacillus chitinolyticus]MCY9590231.1 PadR family transcriptional regulator [Paenibacillus chitinolyticus]MCY9596927.1 PadR family transcriptional regulator [Paenibacillus chitinolyticus]